MDYADHERLLESKEELESLGTNETIASVLMLMLGNKICRPEAVSEGGHGEKCLTYVVCSAILISLIK